MPKLSRGALRLLQLLEWYAARFKDVYPLQSTLARKLGCTDRHVRRYLAELRDAGLLTIKQSGRNASVYVLVQQSDTEKNVRAMSGRMSGRCPGERSRSLYELKTCITTEQLWPKPMQQAQSLDPEVERQFWERYDREMALPLQHKTAKGGKA